MHTPIRRLAALTAFLLGACGLFDFGTSERGRGSATDTLTVGRPTDSISLDPAMISDGESVEVCEQIYEHLVRLVPNSSTVKPSLATHWDMSGDGMTWTFYLRRGVKFHDGTPMNAAAVVFSFERQRDPFHPYHQDFAYWGNSYQNIEVVERVDEHTVRIKIERPYAPFLATLAMFPVSIVSPTAMKKHGKDFFRHPVGTGPFKLVSWTFGERIVLERNEDYWGERSRLRRLVFRTIPDAKQRLIALESGAVHVAEAIYPSELQFVKLHPDLRLEQPSGENVAYMAMNMDKTPFDSRDMRLAINHAVNKEAIVKLVYQGNGIPADGPVPPSMWSHHSGLPKYGYDPAASRTLVAAAKAAGKYTDPRPLSFYVPNTPRTYLPDPVRVARVIQHNLRDVGVNTELVIQDMAAHLKDVQNGKHDLCLLGWSGDNGDPDNFLYVLFDRDSAVLGVARNVSFYRNPELHGLLIYARETSDEEERTKLYLKAQEIIAHDAPWVPLAHASLAVAAHVDVEGLSIHPSGIVYYHAVWLRRT